MSGENGTEDKRLDVAVLGGGISGLTAGFLLARRGLSVAVFERSAAPGGSIRSWRANGFTFELGPNTVLNNAVEIDQLCEAAGVLDSRIEAAPASKKRFIVKGGKLVALPGGPLSFLTTRAFSGLAKVRLFAEPFIRRAPADREESIAQFVRRRLGREFLDYAVGPFVSGVYAGDPEKLSIQHATAKIYALEKNHGSLIRGAFAKRKGPAPAGGMFSFERGLETLPATLSGSLGESWQPHSLVTGVERQGEGYAVTTTRSGTETRWETRAVVSALPAAATSKVFTPLAGDFPRRIASLPYADVAVVCLGFAREQIEHPLDGFGFLAPAVENRHVLGCLFTSSLFAGRAPEGHVALAAFVGGATHPERVEGGADQILTRTLADLRPLLGVFGEPTVRCVEAWRPAIPQYVVGHGEVRATAETFERDNPGVFISGNLLAGVSVADCIRNATAIAGRAAEFVGAS